MQRVQPLRGSYPQFSVLKSQSFHEFRVENWKLAADGSGKKLQPRPEWKLAIGIAVLGWWFQSFAGPVRLFGLAIGICVLVQQAFFGVTHETVMVFPPHGIQLETHRGFKSKVFSTSRTFVPFTVLRDVVINEALYGWNVRCYIVAVTQPMNNTTELKVAFPMLLPHFPILNVVYGEIQMYLMSNGDANSSVQ